MADPDRDQRLEEMARDLARRGARGDDPYCETLTAQSLLIRSLLSEVRELRAEVHDWRNRRQLGSFQEDLNAERGRRLDAEAEIKKVLLKLADAVSRKIRFRNRAESAEAQAAMLREAIRRFRKDAGRHEDGHDALGGVNCSRCVAAYNAAEDALDQALAAGGSHE